MSTIEWPADIAPSTSEFYLEEHTAGVSSPFNRRQTVMPMPGERWLCKLTFNRKKGRVSDRIEALVARMEGRANKVSLFDFRRRFALGAVNSPPPMIFSDGTAFSDGTTFIDTPPPPVVDGDSYGRAIPTRGWAVNSVGHLVVGDYVAFGPNRLHRLVEDLDTDADGKGVLHVRPPIPATYPLASGQVVTINECRAEFRAKTDGQGRNPTVPGDFSSYTLELEQEVPCPS